MSWFEIQSPYPIGILESSMVSIYYFLLRQHSDHDPNKFNVYWFPSQVGKDAWNYLNDKLDEITPKRRIHMKIKLLNNVVWVLVMILSPISFIFS